MATAHQPQVARTLLDSWWVRWIACWTRGFGVRLWDRQQEVEVTPPDLGALRIQTLAWSREGARLAVVATDGSLHVCEAPAGPLRPLLPSQPGELLVAFVHGDARLLVWRIEAAAVDLRDVATGALTSSLLVAQSQPGAALAVSPDGQHAALKMQQHLCILSVADVLT